MNWDGIRTFLALVETPTLKDAAGLLGVSDATVMRHIQSLETSLHTTLFVRTRKGHTLTQGGERFLPSAKKMELLANSIQSDFSGEDDALIGNVTVATTELGADHVLGPALPEFGKQYPGLCITLLVSPDHHDLTQPNPGLALRFERPNKGPYVMQKIGAISWGLFAAKQFAKEWRLSEMGVVEGDEPYIDWAPPVDNIQVALATRRAFPRGRPATSLPTLQGHLHAASAGLGIAHLPLALGLRDLNLIQLSCKEPMINLEAWVVQPRQYRHLARIKAVSSLIKRALSRMSDTELRIKQK